MAAEREPFNHYLTAIRLIARSDVHLNVAPQAFGELLRAFQLAQDVFAPTAGTMNDRLRAAWLDAVPAFDQADEFLALNDEYTRTGRIPATVTLENVLVLKALLDTFLIVTFRRDGPERIDGAPQARRPAAAERT
jgi:hypothetical protein